MGNYLTLFLIGLAATLNLPPVLVLLTFFANGTARKTLWMFFLGYTGAIFALSIPVVWFLNAGYGQTDSSGANPWKLKIDLGLAFLFLFGTVYYYFYPPKTDGTSKFLTKITDSAAHAGPKQGFTTGVLVRLLNPFGIVIYAYGLQQLISFQLTTAGATIGWLALTVGLEATLLVPFAIYLFRPAKTQRWLKQLQDYTLIHSSFLPMIGLASMSIYFFVVYFGSK